MKSPDDFIAIKQPITIRGDTTVIHCTKGDVLVDTEDLGLLYRFTWNIAYKGSAQTFKSPATFQKMHRLIMGDPEGMDVDHINHNQLDNRKANLRVCTHAENGRNLSRKKNNTSGVAGVTWDKSRQKWAARIKVNYKNINLGRFERLEDATKIRLVAEQRYYGEFAPRTI